MDAAPSTYSTLDKIAKIPMGRCLIVMPAEDQNDFMQRFYRHIDDAKPLKPRED